jgi:hypothetical protein
MLMAARVRGEGRINHVVAAGSKKTREDTFKTL